MTDTRSRILEAALQLFSKQGYKETGMREIAQQVAIKAPSIYKHFSNKEAILKELLETYGPKRISNALDDLEDFDEVNELIGSLLNLITAMFQEANDNLVMRILIGESLRNPGIAEILNDLLFDKQKAVFVKLFEKMIQKRIISEEQSDPEILADAVLAMGFYNRYIVLINNDPNKQKMLETKLLKQVQYFWTNILTNQAHPDFEKTSYEIPTN